MANPRIEVEIGAKVEGLTAGVNTAAGQLDKLGKAAQATAPQVQKLTQATQGYNAIGTDFARIIQDAPFGIIGVGNNIQQLAGSFQTLKNTTGSTSAALKASFASIFSSGNALVLGISLLTTAFTVLQMKGFFDTEKKAKDLTDTLDEYKKTLGETAQAQLEGAANADKEIVKIISLRGVIEDETLSREKRLAAVQKLRDEAPSIFKNLSDEQILAGQVGDSYARLTQILVARATASSGINKIVALADEERIILEKNASTLQQIAEFEQKAANFRAQGQQELVLINENQIRYLKEQNPEIQRLAEIEAERVKLTGLVNENLAASVDYNDKSAKASASVNQEAEKLVRSYEKIQEIQFNRPTVSFQPSPVLPGVDLNNIQAQIQGLTALNQQLQASGLSVEQFYDAIANGAAQGFTSFDNFVKSVSTAQQFFSSAFQTLEQGIENTIGNVAFAIGDALASGGNAFKAGGAALLEGIAGIMNQLGQLAIESGFTVLAIKKSLQTLNPYVAIAAGIALVALAGAVSAKAKKISKSSGGGGGGASSVGSSGVGGGTAFAGGGAQGGLFAQNRDLNGELVVRGQDLVYVFGQANNRINKG